MENSIDYKRLSRGSDVLIEVIGIIYKYPRTIALHGATLLDRAALERGNIASHLLRAYTVGRLTIRRFVSALKRMQDVGLVLAFDGSEATEGHVRDEIIILPKLRAALPPCPYGQQQEVDDAAIADYAARCANKAYEEAIYRATHGLVTVEEMRHVA